MSQPTRASRVDSIVDLIMQLARGDFTARAPEGHALDDLDAVIAALNMLAEDFQIERERRRAAERELEDAIDAYESAPALFCSVEVESGRIVQCNRTFTRALGLADGSAVGRPLSDFYGPSDRGMLEVALQTLARGEALAPRDHHLLSASGKARPTLLSGAPVRDDAGRATRLRLIYRDVTAERELEGRLNQAQKLDAVGRLAGGVAHDFNNVLSVILSLSDMLLSDTTSPQGREDLQQIMRSAERGAELASDLLVFSRRGPTEVLPLDANALLQRVAKLAQRTFDPQIELVVDLADDLRPVVGDSGRLEQALLNLAINARDAMPTGGRLELTSELVTITDESEGMADVAPGRYAVLRVTDEGVGMDAETQRKALEPFFTTKEPGKGTGLGLAIVDGVVRQMGGRLIIDSVVGRGTSVRILLPTSEATTTAPPTSAEKLALGSERILVVEDDRAVREVTVRVLRGAGYQVSAAETGRSALELVGEALEPFDLVVLDLLMPGMSGYATAEQLLARGYEGAILLVSGYDPVSGEGGRWPLLQKPYKPHTLLTTVRRVLGPSRQGSSAP